MTATTLNRANLSRLRPPVLAPGFDVADVTPGIVHLGLGGFHRAHMARYTHRLMEQDTGARQFGIIGAGLREADEPLLETLHAQDGLYTLVERSGTEEVVSVVGSLAGLAYGGADSRVVLDAVAKPGIRIVSLTVTENGYCLNPATKRLDGGHPLIRRDLAAPGQPASAIGVIVEALRQRRDRGQPAFTAMTCDNIQGNGDVLRDAVLALARLRDPGLADWIATRGAFPNSMVDRITPVPAPADSEYLLHTHNLRDGAPVVCEDFTQWVIEDHFPAGRPAWEAVGAQFVPDVAPYEAMKLRLLNGSHLAVSGLGRLMGLTYVHETMADPGLHAYMAALMDREAGPTLPSVPGIDLDGYKRTLLRRFGNPAILDTVERVNRDAPLNVLLDPIRARLDMGGGVELLSLALAAWMRRIRGVDEAGTPIPIVHPLASLLQERAAAGGPDPGALLSVEPLFGMLGQDVRLRQPLGRWLAALYAQGSRATLGLALREAGLA